MKKKIISILLACFLVVSTTLNSFAYDKNSRNIVIGTKITYEALMALMALGAAYGLALPKDDDQYWDYTRSLKKHLQLVDEEYLEALADSYMKYKDGDGGGSDNNNNNNNEKEPWKVPFIPGLGTLFKKIADDLTPGGFYGGHILEPIGNGTPSYWFDVNLSDYTSDDPYYVTFSFLNKSGSTTFCKVALYRNNKNIYVMRKYWTSCGTISEPNYIYNPIPGEFDSDYNTQIGFFVNSRNTISIASRKPGGTYLVTTELSTSTSSDYRGIKTSTFNPIPYSPTEPNIEDDLILIPSTDFEKLPSYESLPQAESLPEHIKPPLDVQKPQLGTENSPSPGPGPGTETGPGTENSPGDDFDFTFPSFGDSINFEPLYATGITEKFPFSLPWDIQRIIGVFNVKAVAPKFEVPLLSEKIELDLTKFDELASIVRFFVLIGFIVCLIFISTRLMG